MSASSRVFLVGPESSGKTTLVSQLKHWTASSTAFSTISDPGLLIVNPTTGQEVDTLVLKSNGKFPCDRILLKKLNEESERNLTMSAKRKEETTTTMPISSHHHHRQHHQQRKEFIDLPITEGFSKWISNTENNDIDNNNSGVSSSDEIETLKQEMMNNFEEALGAVTRNEKSEKSDQSNTSSSATLSTFESDVKVEIKEFGGRMAPMWDKFISSQNATFDKLIFVVDVITPLHIPLAAIEFWKCVKHVMSQSSSPTSSRKKFLVFVNKIRCPSVIMKPQDVIESMFLVSSSFSSSVNLSGEQGDQRKTESTTMRKEMLDMMIAQNTINVVVGDTWSGEGIPLVAAWLMMK